LHPVHLIDPKRYNAEDERQQAKLSKAVETPARHKNITMKVPPLPPLSQNVSVVLFWFVIVSASRWSSSTVLPD
jgi:hypothetical protein